MVYRLRNTDGTAWHAGTWIAPDGTPTPLPRAAIAADATAWTEVAGRRIPAAWHVAIAGHGLAVDIVPLNAQSWMGTTYAYWEGPVAFTGSHDGRGYLEMTGY